MRDTPRTDAIAHRGYGPDVYIAKTTGLCRELERELTEVTAAIHKVHPTRRGSLVDMVEDLDSYRETAMNAFRISEKELTAERALADRLGRWMEDHRKTWQWHEINESCDCEDCVFLIPFDEALTAWKEARRGTD